MAPMHASQQPNKMKAALEFLKKQMRIAGYRADALRFSLMNKFNFVSSVGVGQKGFSKEGISDALLISRLEETAGDGRIDGFVPGFVYMWMEKANPFNPEMLAYSENITKYNHELYLIGRGLLDTVVELPINGTTATVTSVAGEQAFIGTVKPEDILVGPGQARRFMLEAASENSEPTKAEAERAHRALMHAEAIRSELVANEELNAAGQLEGAKLVVRVMPKQFQADAQNKVSASYTLFDAEGKEVLKGQTGATSSFSVTIDFANGGKVKLHDAENKDTLPGKLIYEEGVTDSSTIKDQVALDAIDQAISVRDYLTEVIGRNSIDGKGMDLVCTIHFRRGYNNAFWNGRQMTFGDGDGTHFKTFVLRDVFGHEIFHGVTEHLGGLTYQGESGALNEHFSDFHGVMVLMRYRYKQGNPLSENELWLVGAGLFTDKVKTNNKRNPNKLPALRNAEEPGTGYTADFGSDPQPNHYNNRYKGSADNGGVHYNSGIVNAISVEFIKTYLAALFGIKISEVNKFLTSQASVQAFAGFAEANGQQPWDFPVKLWYRAEQILIDKFGSRANFSQFGLATKLAARELLGKESSEVEAMLDRAFQKYGVTPAKDVPGGPRPPFPIPGGSGAGMWKIIGIGVGL